MSKTIAVCFGIGCLAVLEGYALHIGIDGQLFATTIAAMSVMLGYLFGRR